MTTILLDTNGYLRLAKRIRPVLGVAFGAKKYVLRVHPQVEDEVFRNPSLTFRYPWFTAANPSGLKFPSCRKRWPSEWLRPYFLTAFLAPPCEATL